MKQETKTYKFPTPVYEKAGDVPKGTIMFCGVRGMCVKVGKNRVQQVRTGQFGFFSDDALVIVNVMNEPSWVQILDSIYG